ncbi:MAG TPA: metal ABC transporter ATP-binding protein [Clostridiales bacterium]|nr:metal ABC transporter ATP-binding protein [Clostridiales bacterium]
MNDAIACGLHCIKIEDISVKLGQQLIIDKINLHIHCGKITVIIGKNGAGKSTLIKAIIGEYKHNGAINFTNLKNNQIEKMTIGYVPQHLKLDRNTPISVYDLFASYISNAPVFLFRKSSLYNKILKQLEVFDADNLIDKRICELSGGELQRVLLSIAITPMPNLLLLDEPISGVDRKGMELFYNNIKKIRNRFDLAMIIVSHDIEFVKKYADHVILLDKTIIKEGSPEEVLNSDEYHGIFS